MRSMLYYPYVVPPREVLDQAILYWDQMGSIVPAGYALPDSLKMAADHGLYRALDVNAYVDQVSRETLTREAEQIVSSMPVSSRRPPPLPVSRRTRLQRGKLPRNVESRLRQQGVLRDRGATMQGAPKVLSPLLALLARAVADGERDPTVDWVCHTDVDRAHEVAYLSDDLWGAPAWRLQMGSIFKVPEPGTDLTELLDFRKRYNDERIELQRSVDNFVSEIGGTDSPDAIARVAEEIDYATAQIDRASKARGIRLRKAVAYGTVAVAAGAAVSAADALSTVQEAGVAGVGGLLGSLLTTATQTFLKPEAVSGYNYLHRVGAQFTA